MPAVTRTSLRRPNVEFGTNEHINCTPTNARINPKTVAWKSPKRQGIEVNLEQYAERIGDDESRLDSGKIAVTATVRSILSGEEAAVIDVVVLTVDQVEALAEGLLAAVKAGRERGIFI